MIKKPRLLTAPDILRLKSGEEQQAIAKNNQGFKDYYSHIFSELTKEFGTQSTDNLLFLVVEKYHPHLKIKENKGAKKKWNDYLCAMVTVEIDSRRNTGDPLKKAVHDLCKHPIWKKFVQGIDGEEQFKKVYKHGKKSKFLNLVKRYYALQDDWENQILQELNKFL